MRLNASECQTMFIAYYVGFFHILSFSFACGCARANIWGNRRYINAHAHIYIYIRFFREVKYGIPLPHIIRNLGWDFLMVMCCYIFGLGKKINVGRHQLSSGP